MERATGLLAYCLTFKPVFQSGVLAGLAFSYRPMQGVAVSIVKRIRLVEHQRIGVRIPFAVASYRCSLQ